MKTLFLLLTLLCSCITLFAQKQFTYGLHGGPNINTFISRSSVYYTGSINGPQQSNYLPGTGNYSLGVTLGFFVEAPISREFSFQPEFNYSLKGGQKYYGSALDRLELSYLSIPLLLKYKPRSLMGFNAYVGFEVNTLLSASDVYTNEGHRFNVYSKNMYNTFDAAVDIGIGYDFMKTFGVEIRYTPGLTNLLKSNNVTTFGNDTFSSDLVNSTLHLGFRYMFSR